MSINRNPQPTLGSSPDVETSTPFNSPNPSRASRSFALKSTASSRGEMFCHLTGHVLTYESNMERQTATLVLARHDVADVWDQPPAVSYVDENGRRHSHIFDYRVTLVQGDKIAIAVKPADRVVALGFLKTMSLIAGQLDRAFATRIVVFTENELDPVAVHEAELVLIARRTCDPGADDAIASAAETLLGAVPIQQLVDRLGLGARGFSAVARAIGLGLLRRVSHGPLSASSMVKSVVSEGCL